MQPEGFFQAHGDPGGGFRGQSDMRLLAEGSTWVGVPVAGGRVCPRAGEGVGAQSVHELGEAHAVAEGACDELTVVDADVVRPVLLEGSERDVFGCCVVLAVPVLSSDDSTEDHRVVRTCHQPTDEERVAVRNGPGALVCRIGASPVASRALDLAERRGVVVGALASFTEELHEGMATLGRPPGRARSGSVAAVTCTGAPKSGNPTADPGGAPRSRCSPTRRSHSSSCCDVTLGVAAAHRASKYAEHASTNAASSETQPNSWLPASPAIVRFAEVTAARVVPNKKTLACRSRTPRTRPPACNTARSAAMSLTPSAKSASFSRVTRRSSVACGP